MLNGILRKRNNFDISILKSGISVYEVLKVANKVPIFLENHLERLNNSLTTIGLRSNYNNKSLISQIVSYVNFPENPSSGNIRLLIHIPENLPTRPAVFIYFIPHYYPSQEEYKNGISLITVNAEREHIHSKIINLNFRKSINNKIKKKDAYEALLVNKDGYITEGSKSNFFMVKGRKIITAPTADVLAGISRHYILKFCREIGLETVEKKIHVSEISNYDSCFISGTSPGLIMANKIDEINFPVTSTISMEVSDGYNKIVTSYINNFDKQLKNLL